ncbi:adenine nucleotide alpha hydrolase family protein [Rhodococcus opacus]|uniref:hypothetical protein n=1 Tax=Rhodococcus opacus TaxID=37919 RepID=UPI0029551574|nr:hypothetical protein [Rhodococcus opacus]MDV7088436.1 hypothetical protein [Rhodococcus opacus]
MELKASVSVDDTYRSTADLVIDGKSFAVWTESDVPVDGTGTPWLPTLRVTAMRKGLQLAITPAVDKIALEGSLAAQEVLLDWFPETLQRSSTRTETEAPEPRDQAARGVGCFFSGGVDSFYTALKHLDEITHLIIIHGLDISLDNHVLWQEAVDRARTMAAELGKELIEVRSNVRMLHSKHGPHWQSQAHGAFLAHISLLLSPQLRKVYIPASDDESRLAPLGTHPDLDPLWSSSDVEIVHDGTEADRVAKLARIKDSTVAMNHLRVCWWNLASKYNCGTCEKCLRTMIGLRIVGASGQCTSLPREIPPRAVRRMYLHAAGEGGELFARENLERLENLGETDTELVRALTYAVNRNKVQEFLVTTHFYVIDVGFGLVRYWARKLFGSNRTRKRTFGSTPSRG